MSMSRGWPAYSEYDTSPVWDALDEVARPVLDGKKLFHQKRMARLVSFAIQEPEHETESVVIDFGEAEVCASYAETD